MLLLVYLHFWLILLIQELTQKVFSNEKRVFQYSPLPLWISVMFLFCLLAPDLFIFWFAGNLKSLFSVQNSPFALLFCIAPCSLAKGIISFSRSFWEQIAASCYQTSGVLLCFEKEEKNNLLWAASLYSWSEMNSQMKGYISSVPCDTKSDLKSLLLVQSDSEAEEVTLCKTVYDTQRCCVLVLQIQSTPLVLELFLVWQKPHHNVWLILNYKASAP